MTTHPSQSEERLAARRHTLRHFGANAADELALLEYNHSLFVHPPAEAIADLPLPDEPHVATWRRYLQDAEPSNPWDVLPNRLVQLRFPIRAGISQTEVYRLATRKGVFPELSETQGPLALQRAGELRLLLQPTAAGQIPVLIAGDRQDFEALVQALTFRNEPTPVPASMGAVIVGGFNNWDRVHAYRTTWDAGRGGQSTEQEWQTEFTNLVPRKELYQDRFIVLSNGPYSGVSAAEMGLPEGEWLEKSVVIRTEHECAHYFTRRFLGSMRQNLLDEILADYMGISAAAGQYRADWFLRFLGLEDYPRYRRGGRLENYCGATPFSPAAFEILTHLVKAAADHLARFDAEFCRHPATMLDRAAVLLAISRFCLEELAADDAVDRLHHAALLGRPPSNRNTVW